MKTASIAEREQPEVGVGCRVYQNGGNPHVLASIPTAAKTALDVGCGAGDNARLLQSMGLQVDGITLSPCEAAEARPWCRRVFVHNLETGLPDGLDTTYDVCICSHVLEHICWPATLLWGIREKLLRPGSVAVVALPNILHWRYRLPLVFGRFEYTPTGTMDETHFRWYTFESAQKLFRQHGFRVRRAWVQGAFPLFILRRALPSITVHRIDELAGRLLPGLFGLQMLFELTAEE